MGNLTGKVALVTGGATGIGVAIVDELAAQGCKIAIHAYRSPLDEIEKRLTAQGVEVFGFRGDLTREDVAAQMIQDVTSHFGGLDILVNNAGDLLARHELAEMELAFFQKVMAVNMDSMMLVCKHALPHLKAAADGAAIVNVASLAGRKGGHAGSLAYSTAKGATITFTRSMAAEVAADGVRVNAVAPGLILATNFHDIHTTDDSARYTVEHQIPIGRAGAPGDVARAVAYLASEYDGFITGATLDINGGQYMA